MNAVTGEHQYYDAKDVPDWVDHVYTADLIVQQYDYHGTYIHGFINSLFGQRDVTVTTDGYNYIAIGDDVYMYTGITSVVSDQSNIGFIARSSRCAIPPREPLLLNIADQPSYFMALKDAAGLVKMYAMVNVQQYNIVETGSTVAECEANYRKTLADNGLVDEDDADVAPSDQAEVSGVIAEIRSAVLEGNSYYFLRLEDGETFYAVNAAENPLAVILNVGDEVSIQYHTGEGAASSAAPR